MSICGWVVASGSGGSKFGIGKVALGSGGSKFGIWKKMGWGLGLFLCFF